MRRSKRVNSDWETPEGQGFKWEHVAIEVLMDIRGELQGIHSILRCRNVQAMALAAQRIDKRLAKKLPLGGKAGK